MAGAEAVAAWSKEADDAMVLSLAVRFRTRNGERCSAGGCVAVDEARSKITVDVAEEA
jgi:hypothetical protein